MKQPEFGLMVIAREHGEDGATGQAEEHQHPRQGKADAVMGAVGFGIGLAILFGVGHGDGRGIDHFEGTPLEESLSQRWRGLLCRLGGAVQSLGQHAGGQALAGQAVSAIAVGNLGAAPQRQQGLHLTDHLAAGGARVEALPQKTPEHPRLGVDAVAGVGGLVQQTRRQSGPEPLFQLGQGIGPNGSDGLGEPGGGRGQPGFQLRETRSVGWHIRAV